MPLPPRPSRTECTLPLPPGAPCRLPPDDQCDLSVQQFGGPQHLPVRQRADPELQGARAVVQGRGTAARPVAGAVT